MNTENLQQQKLLELTSQSTNCWKWCKSTIVEIIRTYQPKMRLSSFYLSTIVEIIRAYQPLAAQPSRVVNLQQQKLLELTSPLRVPDARFPIYNSRNYQSLLAYSYYIYSYLSSTIVEIIRAYQPSFTSRCSSF